MLHIFLSNRPGQVQYGSTGNAGGVHNLTVAANAGSLDEFLPSLQMEVEIGSWNAMTAQRIALPLCLAPAVSAALRATVFMACV